MWHKEGIEERQKSTHLLVHLGLILNNPGDFPGLFVIELC